MSGNTSSHAITLLVLNPMAQQHLDQIRQHATVSYAPKPAERTAAVREQGAASLACYQRIKGASQ